MSDVVKVVVRTYDRTVVAIKKDGTEEVLSDERHDSIPRLMEFGDNQAFVFRVSMEVQHEAVVAEEDVPEDEEPSTED